jgi:LysM repeat protein
MINGAKTGRIALALVATFALTSCDQLLKNHSEQKLDLAEKKDAEGDFAGAVPMYEGSLDGTPKTAVIHYKLALIYDEHLGQPISALHHFQRYLELAPEGPHAKEVKGFIKEDQLKLTASQGHGATVPQEEAARLKNDNLALRKQVVQLQGQLQQQALLARALKTSGGKLEQVQKELVPGMRTYTVDQGDTLASISRKFYKSAARWKDIQDANFNALEGTAKLKPGMTLMIP